MRAPSLYFGVVILLAASGCIVWASDFSSTNYTVMDPMVEEMGGYSTSAGYQLWSNVPYISPTQGVSPNYLNNPEFLGFPDTATTTGRHITGGGGGSGSSTPPSPAPPPPAPPFTGITSVIKTIVDFLTPDFLKSKPAVVLTPLEQLVPRIPPLALLNRWNLIDPVPLRELVLRPLPHDIATLSGKIPQLSRLFSEVGITRFEDLSRLHNITLNVPGLTNALELPVVKVEGGKPVPPRGILLADLTPSLKAKFPTDTLFTRVAAGKVDVPAKLSLSADGSSKSQVRLVSGSVTTFVLKPEGKPQSVKGYLIFKGTERQGPTIKNIPTGFLSVPVAYAADIVQEETALVLQEFEMTDADGDGIYTAEIEAPAVSGNYEIVTVIQYADAEAQTHAVRLLTVVDPEGYVYQLADGKETRIPGAIVTLEWLNPTVKAYGSWPAADFSQENPQITNMTGQYSFLVPSGFYRLKVTAPGYNDYEGKPFEVKEGSGIHEDIELRSSFWFLKIVNWQTIVLVLVILFLLYNFYMDKRRERLERVLLSRIDKPQV